MQNKPGYLTKKKSHGKLYIYVRKTYREGKNIKHEYIYSFGAMPDALEKMYWYRDNPEQFPLELIAKGYDLVDLYDWIMTMETNVTSKGREFLF